MTKPFPLGLHPWNHDAFPKGTTEEPKAIELALRQNLIVTLCFFVSHTIFKITHVYR